MKVSEIKEYLRSKPGYLKEGGRRLSLHLKRKGYNATVADCKQAIGELRFKKYVKHEDLKPLKTLYFDIETSYYLSKIWQPGYKQFVSYDSVVKYGEIICISYSWNDEKEVTCLKWDRNQSDKDMISEFINILNEADIIVGHNVDRFDLPWVRTRAMFHNLEMLPRYKTVDTLKLAKSKFRFPSNKLDALGEYLGLGRKIKVDYGLWDRVVEKKDLNALQEMMDYCNQDVLLLKKVFERLTTQELPYIHVGVLQGKDKITSPYTGLMNYEWIKTVTTPAGSKQHYMKDLDTNNVFIMNDSKFKKYQETL